jgi:hypothetical protein
MKHFVKASLATAVVMGATLVATGSATAGITNTKHNLGSAPGTFASPRNNTTTSTGEICIFCHTPHGGDTGAPVPLWNKVLTNSTFQTYDQLGTSTLDAGITTIGSVSLACLTCHDGTQAIDNILNAPGSGGYDVTGGGDTGLNWTWVSGGSTGGLTLDANGQFQTGVITNIGTDLRNDHPVSVQYGGGGVVGATTTTRDQDFRTVTRIGTQDRWYIDNQVSGTTGVFDKWDFKLYTRTVAPGPDNLFQNAPEPFVECGSCHDPHLETTTFLRIDPADNSAGSQSNSGSAVCLTCHTK